MSLPEECTIVHTLMLDNATEAEFASALAHALQTELRVMGVPAKVIGKWTGASNRAIRNWMAGTAVPSGFHLVRLMRYSDLAMMTVLAAARRDYIAAQSPEICPPNLAGTRAMTEQRQKHP